MARAVPHTVGMLALLLTLGSPSATLALPMGTPGDTMVMLDWGADERELAANTALNSRWALGGTVGRWTEMQPHGALQHERTREFAALTSTHRLQRWNLPHAQANLWLVGQVGQVRGEGLGGAGSRSRTLAGLSLMADYETTRVYLGGGWRPMRASGGVRHDSTWVRSGFSFFEAEYDAVQPWLIVEAKQTRTALQSETLFTPMLRLIHKRVFVEAGGNRKGAQVNLMLVL